MIVIVLRFVWSTVCHHSQLCQTVVLDRLVRRPIMFSLTKPSVPVVFFSWPLVVQSFLVLLNRCFQLVIWLLSVYCLAYCSIGCLQLCLFTALVLCVTVLNYPWLHQAVVCQGQAIVRDFGRLRGQSILWPCLYKLFLTIGSPNCKYTKLISIYN